MSSGSILDTVNFFDAIHHTFDQVLKKRHATSVYQHASHYRDAENSAREIPQFKLGEKRKPEGEDDRSSHQQSKQDMLEARRQRLGLAGSARDGDDANSQLELGSTLAFGDAASRGGANSKGLLVIPEGYADSKVLLQRLKEKQAALRPQEDEEAHAKRIAKIQAALREKNRRSEEAREKNKQLITRSGSVKVKSQNKNGKHDGSSDDSDSGDDSDNDTNSREETKQTSRTKTASATKNEPVLDLSFGEIRSPVDKTKISKFSERVENAQQLKAKAEELRSQGKHAEAEELLNDTKLQNALSRARTGKDVALLDEKMVKKREKKVQKLKKMSSDAWKKRTDDVKKAMADRQRKREENINKKITTKLAKQRGTYKKEKKPHRPSHDKKHKK